MNPSVLNRALLHKILIAALGLWVFVLPLPHTTALRSSLFALAILCWILSNILHRNLLPRHSPFDLVILFGSLSVLLSTIVSVDRDYSFSVIRSEYMWMLATYFLLVFALKKVQDIRTIQIFLFLSLSLIVVVGIFGYIQGQNVRVDHIVGARAISIFPSFGRAAFYVSMLTVMVLAHFLTSRSRPAILVLGILSGLCLVFLVFTFARGAWLSVAVATTILLWLRNRKLLVALLILALLLPLIMPANAIHRAMSTFDWKNFRGSVVIGDRIWLWRSAILMIRDHFWLGIGFGNRNFQKLYPSYISPNASGHILENAHNLFLQLCVEQGVIGILVFLWLIVSAGYLAIRNLRTADSPFVLGTLYGNLACWVVFLLYSMTTWRYENEIGILLWYTFAVTAVIDLEARAADPRNRENRNYVNLE